MTSRLALVAALVGATAGHVTVEPSPRARRRQPVRRYPHATDVPCEDFGEWRGCGAAAGEGCDRRTLGRHLQHMARVKAFEASRANTGASR